MTEIKPKEYESIDFFLDPRLTEDPYPYFEFLRSKCPITALPHHGVMAVSGYEEAAAIYKDSDTFSSCNSVVGPFAKFSVPLEGDDISAIIEQCRNQLPMNEHMVTMDPPMHTRERALLMRLLTPRRLQSNEAFMRRLADRLLDSIMAEGRCEFISAYAQPFAMLTVADVLGVPEEEHETFRRFFGMATVPGATTGAGQAASLNTLGTLDQWFSKYIDDRRREPGKDVLTDLALAKYPDGSTPDVSAVVRTATFVFAAGQETTARLLAVGLKYLAEDPDLQTELRTHRERIPNFIEEALRIESPVKADFRLARRAATVGEVHIEPATPMMLLNGAANRDPRRFECPNEFRINRPNAREHMAFGRGPHVCPGAPLARAEGRITFERLLERTRDMRLSEEHHGLPGQRRFDYEPTWILRGLRSLHIDFTPAVGSK